MSTWVAGPTMRRRRPTPTPTCKTASSQTSLCDEAHFPELKTLCQGFIEVGNYAWRGPKESTGFWSTEPRPLGTLDENDGTRSGGAYDYVSRRTAYVMNMRKHSYDKFVTDNDVTRAVNQESFVDTIEIVNGDTIHGFAHYWVSGVWEPGNGLSTSTLQEVEDGPTDFGCGPLMCASGKTAASCARARARRATRVSAPSTLNCVAAGTTTSPLQATPSTPIQPTTRPSKAPGGGAGCRTRAARPTRERTRTVASSASPAPSSAPPSPTRTPSSTCTTRSRSWSSSAPCVASAITPPRGRAATTSRRPSTASTSTSTTARGRGSAPATTCTT
mmetsp:Transcript_32678/g.105024  ORF Transcript_32678/g.105024 Transcript_32678/m.105024 type:complete len:331 (-) Transcript_32678:162-1154(-)